MTDEIASTGGPQDASDDPAPSPRVFNLDDIVHTRSATGDPLVDRGMELPFGEMREAAEDPEHPEHEAAKAAAAHIATIVGSAFSNSGLQAQLDRITANLGAAMGPRLDALRAAVEPIDVLPKRDLAPYIEHISWPDFETLEIDDTPQRTLQALIDLNEQTSRLAKAQAEQLEIARAERAEAQKQRDQAQAERDLAEQKEAIAIKNAVSSKRATWVGAIIGAAALVVALLALVL